MKSFFFKCLLFLILLVCAIAMMNRFVRPKLFRVAKARVDQLLSKAPEVEAICLGRSHAAALDYESIGVKGVNMALGGRDLASIEFWLDTMVPKLPQLHSVHICISFSSLYYDNKAFGSGVADARAALYHSLPGFRYMAGDRSDFVLGKFFPFIHPDNGRKLILSLFRKHGVVENSGWDDNFMPEDKMEQSAQDQAYIHSADRKRALRNDPNLIQENIECISRIYHKLASQNIECIFFTPPYHRDYTKYFPKTHINEMKLAMRNLQEPEGLIYFDYSEVERISNDVKYFHNADHMNEHGKKEFSKLFSSQLAEGNEVE